jgi:hypothetical protein
LSIAGTLEAPSWVSSGAVITGGLDLLGLRLPVQFIGGTLLDGVTTVTPSVRYMAFRAWLIHRYGQNGLPDSWQRFTEFSARVECALVLGNLIQDRAIDGLIGADEAVIRLNANTPRIAISPLVKSPATTVYAGPCDQLGISKSRDDLVPALVAERGHPLALKVDERLGQVPLIDRLLRNNVLGDASLDDLKELGSVARIDRIPDDEREALIAAIVPARPLLRERQRIGTYAALLALAQRMKVTPSEADVFDAACSIGRFCEPTLDHVADGWLTYCVRDSIAVTQEAVLAAVMDEITTGPDGGLAGVERIAVIASLMQRVDEHADALRALHLLSANEAVTGLSFRQLYSRVEAKVLVGMEQRQGLSRWTADLSEPRIYKLAQISGAGALTLAVVAWITAAIRVGAAVKENGKEFGGLSYQGWRRFGLRDVVLPELERFHREDRPLRDVAAELAYHTVQQHLQIAWSRLQVDVKRDVALLTAEGTQWFSRGKGFSGGRTASRLRQALGWLKQLQLIDGNGITTDGDLVLKRALRELTAAGSSA